MWRHWQDVWMTLFIVCVAAFAIWLGSVAINCAKPTKLIGYQVRERTTQNMPGVSIYEVNAIREHCMTAERTVATVRTYQEAVELVRILEGLREAQ